MASTLQTLQWNGRFRSHASDGTEFILTRLHYTDSLLGTKKNDEIFRSLNAFQACDRIFRHSVRDAKANSAALPIPTLPYKKMKKAMQTFELEVLPHWNHQLDYVISTGHPNKRAITSVIRLVNLWLKNCENLVQSSSSHDITLSEAWTNFVYSISGNVKYGDRIAIKEEDDKARNMNQYFTSDSEAKLLVEIACQAHFERSCTAESELVFMEPSAGDGAVYKHFPPCCCRRVGIEIDRTLARRYGWIAADFLSVHKQDLNLDSIPSRNIVIISNPPFVSTFTRGNLFNASGTEDDIVVKFIRHALDIAELVVFLLPERYLSISDWHSYLYGGGERPTSTKPFQFRAATSKHNATFRLRHSDKDVAQQVFIAVFQASPSSSPL